MKSVVLFFPKTGFEVLKGAIDLPLSLLMIASTIRDDFNVRIIDQRIDKHWKKNLISELDKDPLCVGISSMTGGQIACGLEVAGIVKRYVSENETNTKVVWGGVHGTLLPEQTIENESIDILVVGEGEITFREILFALERGKSLTGVEGICFKENGRIIVNPQREDINLNELPDLPYDLFDIEEYVHSRSEVTRDAKRVLPFVSSRGCSYQCTYCCNPLLFKQKWRSMSVERTFREVKALVDEYDIDGIVFHDENFLSNPKRALKIAELINGQFSWGIQCRMDSLLNIDVKKLSEMGLKMIQPGIESGSERILKFIRKGETKEVMDLSNQALAKTDIIPNYNFMIGFPGETYADLMESVDFALKLMDDNANAEISGFYIFVPYPGTEMFELAVKEGFAPPKDLIGWSKFDRHHNETPWIADKLGLLNSLTVSSKFLDGKRIERLAGIRLLKHPLELLGHYYRNRWRNHVFDSYLTKILIDFFNWKTKMTI